MTRATATGATLIFLLAACGAGSDGDKVDEPDGTTDSAGDSDTDEPPCIILPSGAWTLNGTSIGHDMFGTLAFDEASCSFTLTDWNMQMDIATGGTIDGETVTFVGDEAARDWAQCFGPAEDENTVRAMCDDGATLAMDYDGP
jgi:hypothetical protein